MGDPFSNETLYARHTALHQHSAFFFEFAGHTGV
jgi:hypothetical protein